MLAAEVAFHRALESATRSPRLSPHNCAKVVEVLWFLRVDSRAMEAVVSKGFEDSEIRIRV